MSLCHMENPETAAACCCQYVLSAVDHVRNWNVWRRRRWHAESGCIFQALAMVVLGLLTCAHPCLSAMTPVDCGRRSCTDDINRISPVCRPIPAGIGIDACDRPPEEMWVRKGSCPSVPKPIVKGSVRTSCGEENGLQIVNISWSLPDDESRRAVTGYKINLFEDLQHEDCSILVPASGQQQWFALHLYEELLKCLEFFIPGGTLEEVLSIISKVRVTSLPIYESRLENFQYEPLVDLDQWVNCFNRTNRSMAVRGKAHRGCLVYHVPANSTAATLSSVFPSTIPPTRPPESQATLPAVSPTTIPHTDPPASQATPPPVSPTTIPHTDPPANISSSQATSPGLSLSPTSTAKESGISSNSSNSNAPTTAAHSGGVTTSSELESRDPGRSIEFLVLLAVAGAIFVALCLGGLACLLYERGGLRLKSTKASAVDELVTPLKGPSTSSQLQSPVPQYSMPLAMETSVETAAFTKPLPPTALTNGKSYVYISYARSDPHHRLAVQKVADWLHGCGIQVIADFYYPEEVCTAPQMFVERGIESAQHILIVWSPAYAQVWSQDVEGTCEGWDMLQSPSLLTRWEVNLARLCLTPMSERNHQVIPVLLISDDDDTELPDVSNMLPVALQACRAYGLGSVVTNKDQLDLLQRLYGMW